MSPADGSLFAVSPARTRRRLPRSASTAIGTAVIPTAIPAAVLATSPDGSEPTLLVLGSQDGEVFLNAATLDQLHSVHTGHDSGRVVNLHLLSVPPP